MQFTKKFHKLIFTTILISINLLDKEYCAMAYRHDPDLEFLDRATHEDLQQLVSILIYDPNDGKKRWTEELSNKLKNTYDYHLRWQDIAGELQCFGADSMMTIFRGGKGVPYREILCDVCDNVKLKYNKKSINIEDIENELIVRQTEMLWKNISLGEKKSIYIALKLFDDKSLLPRLGTSIIASSVITNLIFNGGLLASRLALTSSALTTGALYSAVRIFPTLAGIFGPRAVSIAIPPLTVLSLLSIPLAFSGPAYRVTLPACLAVAHLRKKVALTPREILRMKKLEELLERVTALLEQYKSDDKKTIALYIFAYKTMKDLCFDDDESIQVLIFGESNIMSRCKQDINILINEKNLKTAMEYCLNIGYNKERLKDIIALVGALGKKSDSETSVLIHQLNLD